MNPLSAARCRFSTAAVQAWLWLLVGTVSLQAFPPAPYYTLYGMARDQIGQTIKVAGAQVILLKDDVEVGRTPINSGLQLDQNYEFSIRIDQNLNGTSTYTDSAFRSEGLFSLVVAMNGLFYYPIEVAGELRVGKGGERVRLDLNLGEDSDLDRLPDVWEQWQLFQAGYLPDEFGNWPLHLIDRDGDLDGDGQSNGFEYIAGTFAGDATETLDLEIKETLLDGRVRFSFFAITGKTYTIERSTDVTAWGRVPFATEVPSVGALPFTTVSASRDLAAAFFAITGETYDIERSPSNSSSTTPISKNQFPTSNDQGPLAISAPATTESDSFVATDVGILSAFVMPMPGVREFYQLTVR